MDSLKTLPEPNRKYESETNSDSIADELRAARSETEKENMLTELYY
jgi:hypothetical protein